MRRIEMTDINSPELFAYRGLTEAQLRCAGGEGLFVAESLKVILAALEAGYEPVSVLAGEKHLASLLEALGDAYPDLPVFTAGDGLLEGLTGYRLHRGVLAAFTRRELPGLASVLASAQRVAVLENVTDPTNVGAVFRSAAGLGMDAVLVSESTCDPLHRRASRVSMGTVFRIPWTVLPCLPGDRNAVDTALLRGFGFRTCALALSKDARPIDDPKLSAEPRLALLLGAEGDGLRERTVSACDYTAIIPMREGVDSLNVAAASAVAFWTLGRRPEFSECS